jgi:predicted metalloprotease with PDZ domain
MGRFGLENAPAVIGITTTGAATNRDTLGVLVSSVRPGSPAEKAGIEEGNRIASINGVSLRLAAPDVGELEMAGAMTRRLQRELNKLKPGDDVDLRVLAGTQMKSIKVKTVAPADLYESTVRRREAERATLGLSIGTTGSARDTIGVFVMFVDDGGPAAKAGIEEGARIASINGVDLRGERSAEGEGFVIRSTSGSRFERELAKVKPGEDVDLRVYYGGQVRNVKVKTVSAADLPRRTRAMTIIGDGLMPPGMPAFPDRITLDAPRINDEIRRVIDGVRVGGFGMGFGNRVIW